ncbi:TCP10L isoform 3 [Pongo abelii]|uniref:TCP10L isoform 3 n=1 Tax=Pongo abelii TaxID=9601 RepID=A0A2J8T9A0_PONAB|nr:TCP10L isoform 3 [Pongo abelii]
MEKTAAAAEVPREDGNAGEMPSLQQQITRLHQELGRQELLWADVHRKLQSHIDALRKQNLELREELRGRQRQQWEPGRNLQHPHTWGKNHTLRDNAQIPLAARVRVPLSWDKRLSSNNLAPPKLLFRTFCWPVCLFPSQLCVSLTLRKQIS